MVSVALCTYNGEKYITEQIKSILEQSTPVDEIVICDDGSTDNTISIIEKIKKSNTTDIIIHRNTQNLGVCANFEFAISICKGDIIFLSDQDDIWNPDKVKTIVSWFETHPQKSVVFTDATLISEDDKEFSNKSLWDCIGFNKKMRRYFDNGLSLESFFINKATGATMAIRKDICFPFTRYCNNDNVLHDYCIALKALDNDGLGYIDKPLIKYRLHGNQQAGISYQLHHPEIFSNIHRPLCNIPNNFPFNNQTTKQHVSFGHLRTNTNVLHTIIHVFKYIHIYKHNFLHFFLYDIIYKAKLFCCKYRKTNCF
ncbi:MAG: glycosyltransferase family 2 protein [Bacteroidales bacterium]|nr:glycosyltransferase family 2 protein [Bacteroidales bacterium]